MYKNQDVVNDYSCFHARKPFSKDVIFIVVDRGKTQGDIQLTTEHQEWGPILQELEQRRDAAQAMGGKDKLQRHRSSGKQDARQRLTQLFDLGTFVELGAFGGLSVEGS